MQHQHSLIVAALKGDLLMEMMHSHTMMTMKLRSRLIPWHCITYQAFGHAAACSA
jgi:hypothetical protein